MKIGPIKFDKHTLGNLVKNVAPALAFTPLGVVGAGAAAAVGGKLRGESTGQALTSGVKNAAIGGGLKLGAGVISGARQALASGASVGQTAGAVGHEVADSGLGALKTGAGFLKDNARTITDLGKFGEGVYDRYQDNKAVQQANDRYRSLQPLRDQAMQQLMQAPAQQDYASVFADPTNPQGRYRRVSVGSR